MPSTYTIISSNVLSASAASVTFSAIPSTYTDLVLRASARSDRANPADALRITFNSDTGTNYSTTAITAVGGAASSFTFANTANLQYNTTDGDGATASTFGSFEMYLPNYTSTTSKPISVFTVAEDNSTANGTIRGIANLYRNTTAITSITIVPNTGPNWLSGSSFYLYGIKNS
jgi:hypothetical protein